MSIKILVFFLFILISCEGNKQKVEVAKKLIASSDKKANPDIIFIVDRSRAIDNSVNTKEDIENLLIKETEAAKNGKIYYLNPEFWCLAGGGIISVNVMIDEVVQAF